jgi:hypothetical protein
MGTGAFMSFCQVGEGSTAPTNADSALESYVANSSTVHSNSQAAQSSAPYYGYNRQTFRFAAGTAAGNLSEVGIGWAATGSLFARALIKDELGDPTTITVLSDEVLDVTYELRSYPVEDDSDPFNVSVTGDVPHTYSCVVRASKVTDYLYWHPQNQSVSFRLQSTYMQYAYNGTMGTVLQLPNGLSSQVSSIVAAAYGNNDLYRDFDTIWELDNGNLAGGIKSVVWPSTIGTYQIEFDTTIPKTNVRVLHLNFRVSWDRYVP